MRSTTYRWVSSLLLVTLVFSIVLPVAGRPSSQQQGGVALAADGDTGPAGMETIVSEGFEGSLSSWSITPIPYQPPKTSTGLWGAITNLKRTGTKSLWCSGSVPSKWPLYPSGSHSDAKRSLPQLANYYYSQLSLYYNMLSLGAADDISFGVGWYGSDGFADNQTAFPRTSSNQWVPITRVMSSTSNYRNMSRRAGTVYLHWADVTEGPLQTPKTGRGVLVDDFTVQGYTYGPVRNLLASTTDTAVVLDWDVPATAIGNAADDTRSIGYRVYRSVDGVTPVTWTELTSSRITETAFTDSTALVGTTYRYAVQAWAPGTGTGRGEAVYATATRPKIDALNVTITAPSVVRKNTTFSISYTVTNLTSSTLTGVAVVDTVGTVASGLTLAPSATEVVPRDASLASTTDWTVQVTADGGHEASAVQRITVQNPAISLSVVPTAYTVIAGSSVDIEYTVRNTGTDTLRDIAVDSPEGPVGNIASLASGQSQTLVRSVTPLATGTFSGDVVATFGTSGTPYYGTVTASGTSGVVTVVDPGDMPERIWGSNRYETALRVSRQAFPSPLTGDRAVVVASAFAWPDALCAAALAGSVRGPLLLASKDSIPASVVTEITSRLAARKVYLIGSTAVLGSQVEQTLRSHGLQVVRLGGTNRYDTSRLVANEVLRLDADGVIETAFVATGMSFPDALSATSLSAKWRAPVLLTAPSSLPGETDSALRALRPATIVICGGTSAVSASVEGRLKAYSFSPQVIRRGGSDRYQTSKLIAEYGRGLESGVDGVIVATGTDFPDALSGGVYAGIGGPNWRPLMLTDPSSLSRPVRDFVQATPTVVFGTVLGGTTAVSDRVASQLQSLF